MMAAAEHALDFISLERVTPDDEDERAVASELAAALLVFAGDWWQPVAVEALLGGMQRETLRETEGPAAPFQLLLESPRPPVEVRSLYGGVETCVPRISREALARWLDHALAQPCREPESETSVKQVVVLASRVRVSDLLGTSEASVQLDSNMGLLTVPIARRDDGAWIEAPPGHLVQQPVSVSLDNDGGSARFHVHVHWTPWVGEATRADSPLARGVARLIGRGWQLATS